MYNQSETVMREASRLYVGILGRLLYKRKLYVTRAQIFSIAEKVNLLVKAGYAN